MCECDLETSTTEWVIECPASEAIFRELGLEYCCAGISLEYACQKQSLDPASVLARLRDLPQKKN